MPYFTYFGDIIVLLIICIGLFFVGNKKIALIAILGLIITSLFVSLIKPTVGELRPFLVLQHVNLLVYESGKYSFPSGHTSLVFTMATILGLKFRKIYPAFIIAAIVGFSRIYLGVHYPGDVLGGIIIGVLSGLISLKLGDFIFKKFGVYNGDY